MAPDQQTVTALVEPIVTAAGFDADEVSVARGPGDGACAITVVVDGDDGVGLDALTAVTRALTERFDDQPWAQDYTLDVTSRGVDRPLTQPRHWRRNRGRKAEVVLPGTAENPEKFTARIGRLDGDSVVLVVNRKGRLQVREVPLSDVESAVVVVEFGEPSPAELKLCRDED
ncbi:ribosome maturation factor RimP [Gordonia sp. (in: high G+C Gram-positive bacteria)]|uniref:ribosome maturation factor RimP n=1 Tax=Gordonia sp. (in: high G+C Gram-positive bacteria) TaxID=84139 RepID=UPI0039E5796F